MNRQKLISLASHTVASLIFPLATGLGFQFYITLFGPPLSRGVAIGLAVQLIFAAFVLANALIAMTTSMKVKIALTSALVIANLTYLLPQHPLRALFFAGLSGVLTLAAIYITTRLTPERKSSNSHQIKD
ncbi:hypothetical protein ACQKFS_08540 [Pseudomonas guineae]|uniref:hypothetical protein n=1 Tax=Pseudomonas guineae TaxID=425504 RepID=UPI003CFE0C22